VLASLAGAAVLALVIATKPAAEVPAGVAFVVMAFFLGIGTGGVFAWVARRSPAARVGSVTGVVGAAGGLGGYFPPLVMGGDLRPAALQLHHRSDPAVRHRGHRPAVRAARLEARGPGRGIVFPGAPGGGGTG
jgi:hypothetical protein